MALSSRSRLALNPCSVTVDASPESLTRLLPDRWAQAHPEHVLSYRLEESRERRSGVTSGERIDNSQPDSQRSAIAQPLWQRLASGGGPMVVACWLVAAQVGRRGNDANRRRASQGTR